MTTHSTVHLCKAYAEEHNTSYHDKVSSRIQPIRFLQLKAEVNEIIRPLY